MKITRILSTSALALLLGMTVSHASDSGSATVEDDLAASSAGVTAPAPVLGATDDDRFAAAVAAARDSDLESESDEEDDPDDETVYDPRDTNHDGHVSLGEKWKHHFDADGDGHVSIGEFFGGLWKGVKGLFMSLDTDGDGYVEFEEISHATHEALETFGGTVARILSVSETIRGAIDFVPENVRGPLVALLDLVDDVAGHAEEGVKTAKSVRKQVTAALKDLRDQLDGLLDGDATPEEISGVMKSVYAYLEMIKGTKITGKNKNLTTSLEKHLAHVNHLLKERVVAANAAAEVDGE